MFGSPSPAQSRRILGALKTVSIRATAITAGIRAKVATARNRARGTCCPVSSAQGAFSIPSSQVAQWAQWGA